MLVGMDKNRIPDFHEYLEQLSQDLELLRQNRLLDEGTFIKFAKDRGVPVWGVVTGDPGDLHKRGWLTSDGRDHNNCLLFHPFRICPLHRILEVSKLNIATSASLRRDRVLGLVEQVVASLPAVDEIGVATQERNRVADLAILLEPIYWPRITGRYSLPLGMSEGDYKALVDQYRRKALHLVEALDPNHWRKIHESLRVDAALMDENNELYLLLRLATWRQREKLKGRISGALWIRHVAEVIRRAFEEVHVEQWPEEDQAFGTWYPGGRKTAFGSERPLDDELQSKPYLAWGHGLFTGSTVRWYVEGETEYYAVLHGGE